MALTIKKINEIAYINDCLCLDKEYINCTNKLTWCCKKGHLWERSWATTKRGTWCSQCKKEKKLIIKLKQVVEEREGYVFFGNNVTVKNKQTFMCKHDHIWQAVPSSVVYSKSWCFVCSRKERLLGIDVAHKIAKENKGYCLSKTYKGNRHKLVWKCFYGHTWPASLNSVKDSHTWCPKCNIYMGEEITRYIFNILFEEKFEKNKPKWLNNLELDGYCEKLNLAFEYDGQQHYKFIKYFHKTIEKFKNLLKTDRLKNKLCQDNGITLIRIPFWVEFGNIKDYIINKCNKFGIDIPGKNKIIDYKNFKNIYLLKNKYYDALKQIVESKGGTLLKDVYINAKTKVQVRCENNHIWSISYNNLKSGYWCPHCVNNIKHTIEKMRELAKSKGGRCLSTTYTNSHTKLTWECEKKHVWDAEPQSIIKGTWCADCVKCRKYILDDMKKLAKNKGGTCLSKKYTNVYTELKWKCKNNHVWSAIPRSIIKGAWCKKCNNNGSKTATKL